MPSAGNLVVTLTTDQAKFVSGMAEARGSVDKLGQGLNGSQEHFKKFNMHSLASRHAIGTFAAATGTAVGPLSLLVHAFMLAPGPIGLALAGILAFKEALGLASEEARKAAEQTNKFSEDIKRALEIGKPENPFKNIEDVLHVIGTDIGKTTEQAKYLQDQLSGKTLMIWSAESTQKELDRILSEKSKLMEVWKVADAARKTGKGSESEKAAGAVQAVSAGQFEVFRAEHSAAAALDRIAAAAEQTATNTQAIAGKDYPDPLRGK